jgi:transposase
MLRCGAKIQRTVSLTRERFLAYVANVSQATIVLEAGSWARAIGQLGHEVKLIHAKFVRPFVKTNKNDWKDAAAICEAAQRPTTRFVALNKVSTY